MKNIIKLLGIFLIAFTLLGAECSNGAATASAQSSPATQSSPAADSGANLQLLLTEPVSTIFVQDTDGTDDGVKNLIQLMQSHGINFYRLITSDDVVILKINCQWAERGGTNTDLIRSVIKAIVEHPNGFTGEVIVADNGQGQFGSERRGGSLSWANANSADRKQSVMDVVRIFQRNGYRVSGVLWDDFTGVTVQEFSAGDTKNGFVVEDTVHSTGLEISYPKFVTEFGTHVSFKQGIWEAAAQAYASEKLKVINMPVLKSHGGFQVTAAVKNYMGTPSDRLTNRRAHNSVGNGGMGTQMAHTRMPVLNILDMIWIGVDRGPSSSYATAKEINKIAASIDPVALDYWASKYILMPEAAKLPGGRAPSMNPDGTEPGTFGRWLRLSMQELHKAGIWVTMDEAEITVVGMQN
ncbi:MAG: DUF362 domain-containing protein [Treponema sp.]|nr:DUF362 domain-containing protein [Treponema sp.]